MSVSPSSRPAASRPRASARSSAADKPAVKRAATSPSRGGNRDRELVFTRSSFVWIGIGVALMLLGMALMAGGAMPSPDVWDESLIYSFRRITLAPIVILSGLGVITYAIFKK